VNYSAVSSLELCRVQWVVCCPGLHFVGVGIDVGVGYGDVAAVRVAGVFSGVELSFEFPSSASAQQQRQALPQQRC
jgi:hypothetical protein